MKLFVFVLSADRTLVIQADNIDKAMAEVENNWYPGAFEDSFEVKTVTGSNLNI